MTPSVLDWNRLTLERRDRAAPDIIAFLEETLWGTGGLQYRVCGYDRAVSRLPNPHFFTLRDKNRLIASVMFIRKRVWLGTRAVKLAYLSLLAVDPGYRGGGIARRLVEAVRREIQGGADEGAVGLIAYVEPLNACSLAVFERCGFSEVGRFRAMTINRPSPRRLEGARFLRREEVPEMRSLLQAQYADHLFGDFDLSLRLEEYRVLEDPAGRIVAGLQRHREHWRLTRMPGVAGWAAMRALPRLSWARRHLFDPSSCRFIHIGNLFAKPGRESELYRLIEDALSWHRVPFAAAYVDPRSPFFRRFAKAGSFGLLNALMSTPVCLMGWFKGLSDQEDRFLRAAPIVISPLDIG